MACGIYVIENVMTGKKYIGQGVDVQKRMVARHESSYILNRAIKKYGKENFTQSILVYCESKELDRLETECIRIFHSHYSEHGYNITWGGSVPMRGRSHTYATKLKIGNIQRGRSKSFAWRIKIGNAQRGEKGNNFGKHPSEETRRKMAENHSDNSGERNPMYGKYPSEETRRKLSQANMGRGNANFGKKLPRAKSRYFGVRNQIADKRFIARVSVHGEEIYLGCYITEFEAALAYDDYVIKNSLPNPLNFPGRKP